MSASHQPSCCIVYTTDRGYLFPTLVSAIQARRHASPEKADVSIFCIDLNEEVRAVFAPICAREGVSLVSVPSDSIECGSAMLARLFLGRFVPEQYTQFLYLDGDVQILGSLDPLIDAKVPAGRFLAANDPISFLVNDGTSFGERLTRHILSLGLSEKQSLQYFNSGVLRINRAGWDEIGERAWRCFRECSESGSRFPDQDALNAVAIEQKLPMSLAWNYPAFLRNSRVEHSIHPRIKHFMSQPKPWHGNFPPWTRKDFQPYLDAVRKHALLGPFCEELSLKERMVYHLQQHGKRALETVTWGYSKRRDRVLEYEADCVLSLDYIAQNSYERPLSPA